MDSKCVSLKLTGMYGIWKGYMHVCNEKCHVGQRKRMHPL